MQAITLVFTAFICVYVSDADRYTRLRRQLQHYTYSQFDPCSIYAGPGVDWRVVEQQCRTAFNLLDNLPPNEVPLHCQRVHRHPYGPPKCRGPFRNRRCTVKGNMMFIQRSLAPDAVEVGEMDMTVPLSFCVSTVGRTDIDPSKSIDLENYLNPSNRKSEPNLTMTTTGVFSHFVLYYKEPDASPENPFTKDSAPKDAPTPKSPK